MPPRAPQTIHVDFPIKGVSDTTPYSRQMPGYAFDALNVVPFDREEDRIRGGQRSGTTKYIDSAVSSGNAIQTLTQATTVAAADIDEVQTDAPAATGLVLRWKLDDGSGSTATDDSGNGRDGTLQNSPTWISGQIGTNALRLDGTNQYIQGPSYPTSTGSQTYALWAKGDNAEFEGFSEDQFAWIAKRNAALLGPYPQFGPKVIAFLVNVPGSGWLRVSYDLAEISGFDLTEWHHYVGRYDQSEQRISLWVDGAPVKGANIPVGSTINPDTGSFRVGADDAGGVGSFYDGDIDDIRIYHRSLTGSEIAVLATVVPAGGSGSGGDPQRNQYIVTAAGGNIYRSDSPPTAVTQATNGSAALSTTLKLAAQFGPPSPSDSSPADQQQFVYFADGTNYKRLNVNTNTVEDWTAAAGSMPVDSDGNTGRILALYRNRLVISGIVGDAQNWFMSAADDPRDFDYSPTTPNAQQAVAGNVSEAGKLGDVVTALIPLNDDVMIFGGDRTIWQLSGDPAEGGRIDNITYEAGVLGPDAWCRDTFGGVYFLTTQGLMYMPRSGGTPDLVSASKLDRTLRNINRSDTRVLMVWDRDNEGVYIFLTPLAQPVDAPRGYWYDARTAGFWPMQFAIETGPTAVAVFDGDAALDRRVLLGGWDSFIRRLDDDAKDDDTTSSTQAIRSYVDFGPITGDNAAQRILVSDTMCVLDRQSDPVQLQMFAGQTPEQSVTQDAIRSTRTLRGGMNNVSGRRVSGNAIRLRVIQETAGTTWAYETGHLRVSPVGLQRRLG